MPWVWNGSWDLLSFVVHQLEIVVYLKVMLGDPNNKVFVDQERILYLGGNIDVKQKQLLVVRIIGAFIVSPDELYELGDKVKKSRTELYYVGRAEQVRSARGKYVLTADTVEVLKSHLHAKSSHLPCIVYRQRNQRCCGNFRFPFLRDDSSVNARAVGHFYWTFFVTEIVQFSCERVIDFELVLLA